MAEVSPGPEAARRCPWPAAQGGRHHRARSNGTNAPTIAAPSVIEFPGVQTTGGAEHDDRRILLVLRRLADLVLGQFERDAVALVGDAAEAKRAPVDHDLAAADAEESAEID